MRVALIVSRLEQLGPVIVMQALVNSLAEDYRLLLKVFYIDKSRDPEIKFLVPVERLHPGKFCFHDFDIVHTSGIRPDLFAFLNRKRIKYHISTIHNLVFEDLTFLYNKLISIIVGYIWLILWTRADKLVCLSNVMKEYYSKWFSLKRLEVIYNGISGFEKSVLPDNDVIKTIDSYKKKGFIIIGTVGILNRRKGIDQIIHSLEYLKEHALVVIGSGKEINKLKSLACQLNVSDRCFFCGYRSNAKYYYTYFDVYVSSSRSEGFGLTLLEAASQQTPIICSDIAVFTELFSSEEVGFYRLNDIESLANAINAPYESMENKTEMAYIKYKNKYTGTIMARKYYELYHSEY